MSSKPLALFPPRSVGFVDQSAGTGSTSRIVKELPRPRAKVPDYVLKALLPVSLFLLWELVAWQGWVDPLFVPGPRAVVVALADLFLKEGLWKDLRVSGTTVIEGFVIGGSLGLLTGVSAGISATVEKVLGGTLNAIRQVPPMAFLPLIILWAGAGNAGKIVVISKVVFFPVFLNTLQGIRNVASEYVEVGKIFEYSRLRLLRKVILPAALPSLFVGIRYGAGMAWFMIIAAEMMGSRHGLGFLLMRSQELLLTDQLFLVIILIGSIGFGVDVGLRAIERRLLRWKRGFAG